MEYDHEDLTDMYKKIVEAHDALTKKLVTLDNTAERFSNNYVMNKILLKTIIVLIASSLNILQFLSFQRHQQVIENT